LPETAKPATPLNAEVDILAFHKTSGYDSSPAEAVPLVRRRRNGTIFAGAGALALVFGLTVLVAVKSTKSSEAHADQRPVPAGTPVASSSMASLDPSTTLPTAAAEDPPPPEPTVSASSTAARPPPRPSSAVQPGQPVLKPKPVASETPRTTSPTKPTGSRKPLDFGY
jgi:hypothetical protein